MRDRQIPEPTSDVHLAESRHRGRPPTAPTCRCQGGWSTLNPTGRLCHPNRREGLVSTQTSLTNGCFLFLTGEGEAGVLLVSHLSAEVLLLSVERSRMLYRLGLFSLSVLRSRLTERTKKCLPMMVGWLAMHEFWARAVRAAPPPSPPSQPSRPAPITTSYQLAGATYSLHRHPSASLNLSTLPFTPSLPTPHTPRLTKPSHNSNTLSSRCGR